MYKCPTFFILESQPVNCVSNFYMYSEPCCQSYTKLSFGQKVIWVIYWLWYKTVQRHHCTSSIKNVSWLCIVLYRLYLLWVFVALTLMDDWENNSWIKYLYNVMIIGQTRHVYNFLKHKQNLLMLTLWGCVLE